MTYRQPRSSTSPLPRAGTGPVGSAPMATGSPLRTAAGSGSSTTLVVVHPATTTSRATPMAADRRGMRTSRMLAPAGRQRLRDLSAAGSRRGGQAGHSLGGARRQAPRHSPRGADRDERGPLPRRGGETAPPGRNPLPA